MAAGNLRGRQRRTALLFIAPFVLLFLLVTIAPIGYAVWMSLFHQRSSGGLGFGGGTTTEFSGIRNYTRALSSGNFQDGFGHIALYCAIYIPVMILGALLIALLLDSGLARARRTFQVALFMPHAIPDLIAAIIWVYLYTPGLSPIIKWLDGAGLHWDFLAAGHAAFSVVNISVWQWIGYNMIIFYAALQAIPREVLEAATADGAGPVRTAVSVKVPMIRSAVVLTTLFTVIGSIQVFTQPQALAAKSAGMDSSWSPTMFIYNAAFAQHDYGLAAAASIVLTVVLAALSYAVTRIGGERRPA